MVRGCRQLERVKKKKKKSKHFVRCLSVCLTLCCKGQSRRLEEFGHSLPRRHLASMPALTGSLHYLPSYTHTHTHTHTHIGKHITCTTDTVHNLTHPTLMYNIFTSTLGIKCALPVSYARQHQLSHTFPITLSTVGTVLGAPSALLLHPNTLCFLLLAFGLRFGLLFGFSWPLYWI